MSEQAETKAESKPMIEPHQWTDGGDKVLILRKISKDRKSHNSFDGWGTADELNIVVRPEKFVAEPTCGNGLHGWAWGMGLGDGSDYSIIDDVWLVLAARPEDVVGNVDKGQKCKCREAIKIFDGTFAGAWAMVNGGRHRLIEAMAAGGAPGVASGDSSTAASSGYSSKAASSGYFSKAASSGNSSTAASSGDFSTAASSGYFSKAASSGYSSTAASSGYSSKAASSGYSSKAASSGYFSTAASSGDFSTAASSGDFSTAASSGNSSTAASSGDSSTAASSGDSSTAHQSGASGIAASVGNCGEVMAGKLGCIVAFWWNNAEKRYRAVVGYVGENGIEPNVRYRLNDKHEFEPNK